MNIKTLKLLLQILQLKLRVLLLQQKLTIPSFKTPKYVVVHHAASVHTFEQINNYHKDKWGFKSSLGYFIGYHKFIGFDGKLYVGRIDTEEGAHCVEKNNPGFWNKNSVGICLQGNTNKKAPTSAQLVALKQELDKYKKGGASIKAHNSISVTSCPGNKLLNWLRKNYL